jgi:hypothetical protein
MLWLAMRAIPLESKDSQLTERHLQQAGEPIAFEPFGLPPAMRAALRKNESSRFAFFLSAKAMKPTR